MIFQGKKFQEEIQFYLDTWIRFSYTFNTNYD